MKIFLAYTLLSSCAKQVLNEIQSDGYLDIKLAINGYNSMTDAENSDIKSLNAFPFRDNTLLNKVYSGLSINNKEFSLPISHYTDWTLYFIANLESVSSEIQKYMTADEADYVSANPEKDLLFLTGKKIKLS